MEVTRIFDLLERYQQKFPKDDALCGKEKGQWTKYSTSQFVENSYNIASGLIAMGFAKDDKVAIISNNRPEWNFVDFGIQLCGGINVPIYPTIGESDLKFILTDAEVKYVFVSSQELFAKVEIAIKGLHSVKDIFTFNDVPGGKNWQQVVDLGRKNPALDKINEIKSQIKPGDLVTILYTSGTTGNPKGVMLSHNNLVSNFKAVQTLPPVDQTSKALSFLPLNHVYERMLTYCWMNLGVSIYYAESLETIGDNLKEIKPEIFSAVPRLLEKVYDKIVGKGHELTGIKKKLFFWALNLGLRYEHDRKNGWWYEFQLSLANKIIFSKWREALGGNVRAIVSGGAALQSRLARVFWAARINVLEGYGLTETSPVIAVNTLDPGGCKFGTVGPLLKDVSVKIAEDGEILVKGPNVMLGYYKRPDLTEEVLSKDGWFHTGDIGIFEEGKYLKITDRKKEIFKTSGGKYIAPQIIENKLKESPFIEQVLVIGENQKFASALIVPSFLFAKEWCRKKGIQINTNQDIVDSPDVVNQIKHEIARINSTLGSYEQIKKFELLPREWNIESGEITPKMSLKRKVITETNKELLDRIYGEAKVY